MLMVCGQPYNPLHTPEIDAQFSVRYVIANSIVRGRATPAEFCKASAMDENILQLAQDITLIEEPDFIRFDQCEVEIKPSGDKPVKISAAFGRGWPENPLSWQDLHDKFLTCCALSPCSLFKRGANEIVKTIDNMENADFVTELTNVLCERG